MKVLHVFDMDGTLLRGTTASLEIARTMNCLTELHLLEKQFSQGDIDTKKFAAELQRLWSNLQYADVAKVFHASPWIGGIKEVFDDIRTKGEISMVITLSPDFFAQHLKNFGVDIVVASNFPALPFRESIDPEQILTPESKLQIVKKYVQEHGLNLEKCVAYGDSGSDIPLFNALTNTVAINGTDKIREIALIHYEGNDLWQPYQLIRKKISYEDIAMS
ncbi:MULTISPECIES: HAD family hydrolase [Photorhabdus]|uniref:HAD-IB family phosphatase n=2 Tax=Photorhabdus TaxID=29487 RepID=A0ABX0AWW1_9GAMM|nr:MULTISPECIES: HAD-IB family phosphatase [Photorhabdus]MCC8372477.1 HAD-IB family phosphatase [Photorhabdus bodei]MCC8464447.1 HAD-IB family phosphatase [Photorhabdus bodei]MCT8353772.1 HAD-IB family phosphatase [Photorhabdus kayaii]MDB6371668.1 HAD-IB family phosphatase [Photorhabdus bodei]NDL11691.1 HAD-IB family phosphatase [Photorhabdus kayaii]